ncbi:hypothetical protein [Dysgonomonas sp. 25]|uniref:hypothetical protein n=1 Tax=Dysgonomonas sp. 25 TaxID=2302933 RepID=UPI0013D38392|nr:hypothetical protein [Dysgonomonas sp. 25]NDV69605.1 DUF1566 domain-containing protein [Dysgonomonas sp. 25]
MKTCIKTLQVIVVILTAITVSGYAQAPKGQKKVKLTSLTSLSPVVDSVEDPKSRVGLVVYNTEEDASKRLYPATHVWDGDRWINLDKFWLSASEEEIIFSSGTKDVINPYTVYLAWAPESSIPAITTSPVPGFPEIQGYIPAVRLAGGVAQEVITPKPFEVIEVENNPFLEKALDLTVTLKNEQGEEKQKRITLRQLDHKILTKEAAEYIMDGQEYQFNIKSNARWVAEVIDPDGLIASPKKSLLLSGDANYAEGYNFQFQTKVEKGANKTAHIKFTSPDNLFAEYTVTIKGVVPTLDITPGTLLIPEGGVDTLPFNITSNSSLPIRIVEVAYPNSVENKWIKNAWMDPDNDKLLFVSTKSAGKARTATVTVTNGILTKTVELSQNDVEGFIVGDYVVARYDVGIMNYNRASKACSEMSPAGAWRLPSMDEVNTIAEAILKEDPNVTNKYHFSPGGNYWSSSVSEERSSYRLIVRFSTAQNTGFAQVSNQYDNDETVTNQVRCIRDLE